MKKRKTYLLAALPLLALATTTMAACGGGSTSTAGDLNIACVKLGYGTDWVKEVIKAFEAKYNVKVGYEESIDKIAYRTKLESKTWDRDLVFNQWIDMFPKYYLNGPQADLNNQYLIEDLTDVWESKPEGETKTIKEKIDPEFENYYNFDGHYYGTPWVGGALSIVRNLDSWKKLGYSEDKIPLTTDELLSLCGTIKNDGKGKGLGDGDLYPFIYAADASYYEGWLPVFMGQYAGKEAYRNFLQGKTHDGSAISENVYKEFETEGMATLNFFNTLISNKSGFQSPKSDQGFSVMQGLFLSGDAVFCVNGTWLENEMKTNYPNANIDMIRTPVISAIVNRLSFKDDASITDKDAKLREIITYVDDLDDGKTPTKPAGVTDADIAIVTEARHFSAVSGGIDHQAIIPSYAKHKDVAKNFLRFLYSDEGMKIYRKTLRGVTLPLQLSTGTYTDDVQASKFIESSSKISDHRWIMNRESTSKYFILAGMGTTLNNKINPNAVLRNGEKTPREVYDALIKYNKESWDTIIKNLYAGE